MVILGINYFYHDSTACLVVDGRLVVALEEERFTRRKHTWEFPVRAIKKCLEVAGLTMADVDAVAVSIKPSLSWGAKLAYGLANAPHAKSFVKHEVFRARGRQRSLHEWYKKTWPNASKRPPLHFVPHHLTHAAGTFFVSPYERAAILSLDGSGEWATSFLGVGEGTRVTSYGESFFPMSLGSFYEAATQYCGFQPNYDEGKTMGLAPLGDPEPFFPIVDKMVRVNEEGQLWIDLSYFNYQFWGHERCSQKFFQTFGPPREKGGEFKENHLNVAAAFQKVLEERALEICAILRRKTSADYLIVSGGVALNSVMNGRILRESGFKDLYVMPAAGDNGTAIGAAYYVYHAVLGYPRKFVHDNPYVGNSYSEEHISALIKECKLNATRYEDIGLKGAQLLREGRILGWFQGNMEIGPRALGNRSILADPTLPGMKDKINAEVKHREAYRPFAPSVTVEARKEFFDIEVEAPFMLKVCDVKPDKRSVIPAVTHVDGSARVQTVRKEINPRYHDLITRFGELSGVPVVLNTSFNIMGEPIVESPTDAIRCFFSTGLDSLVLGNYVIGK